VQVEAQGQIAAEHARAKEKYNAEIAEKTAKGWAAALAVVRADADRRVRQYATGSGARVSPVPSIAVDSLRIADAPQDALPPPERIITDCAEDSLKLVWLQYHVKQVLHE
jgi:hypothetical protein